jgi:predicted dehydrogenase
VIDQEVPSVNWGILGPGHIARSFARGLREARGAHLGAVGSRDLTRARSFASEFQVERAWGSYLELARDPDLDAVYVASPHSLHEEHSILCLEAGKHVLCEKPFALNAAQARRMIEAARTNERALMEAMWTRFIPALRDLCERVADGAIGDVRFIEADFGFRANFDPQSRLFAPKLGGGALLDLGVYPINLAFMLCGEPEEVTATANLGRTGVDEETAIRFRHANGAISQLYCSLRANTHRQARIVGTEGRITVPSPWWSTSRFSLERNGAAVQELVFEKRGGGYAHQAEELMEVVRSGARESQIMPLAESLTILETMDGIREAWGLRYPSE